MSSSRLKQGYRAPAEELSGYKTLVRDDSAKGLPTDLDREKQVVLPPDSATPNTPAQTDGGNKEDHSPELPHGEFIKPDNDIPERPRTLPEPGEERGSPTKFDYGMPTRRNMTVNAYKPKKPFKRQRQQIREERRDDHLWYKKNSPRLRREQKVWYKRVKNKSQFQTVVEHGNEYPKRHKRLPPPGPGQKKRAIALPLQIPVVFVSEEDTGWTTGIVTGFHPEDGVIVYETPEGEAWEMGVEEFLATAIPINDDDEDVVLDLLGVSDDEAMTKLALKGYKPTKTRRKKWRGQTKTKGRRYERKRKRDPRRKQYKKRYTKRRSKNPQVKRIRQRRRRNPARWKKRGSVLTTPEIAFLFGPEDKLGYLHSVSPMTGLVTFVVDEPNVTQLQSLPLLVFLEAIIPLEEADEDALFDLLETEVGPEVYEDEFGTRDVRVCAGLYGVDPDSPEFAQACEDLTGKATLESMTPDERVLVNSVLVTKVLEGGSPHRDPEDFESEDDAADPAKVDSADESFYYGEVDLPEDVPSHKRVAHRYVTAWLGTNWQYDQEAPNAHDEVPSTPNRPDQPDSTTTWRKSPQDKQTPAAGPLNVDTQDAPAASGKAPGGDYVSEGGYIGESWRGKTAAKMNDIVGNCSPDILARAKRVAIKLKRADPTRGIWLFQARGSKGETYTVRVKGIKQGNVDKLTSAQMKVSCDCNFFRWQGPEHWAKANSFLYGKPRGTASKPDIKDPSGRHWACKHVLACLNAARKFRLSSEGGWPQDASYEPEWPSVTRVADQWLGITSIDDSE